MTEYSDQFSFVEGLMDAAHESPNEIPLDDNGRKDAARGSELEPADGAGPEGETGTATPISSAGELDASVLEALDEIAQALVECVQEALRVQAAELLNLGDEPTLLANAAVEPARADREPLGSSDHANASGRADHDAAVPLDSEADGTIRDDRAASNRAPDFQSSEAGENADGALKSAATELMSEAERAIGEATGAVGRLHEALLPGLNELAERLSQLEEAVRNQTSQIANRT